MSRTKKVKLTPEQARAENERLTSIVDSSAWDARPGEWRAGEFEVRVFAPCENPGPWKYHRVVVRGRVSGRVVESSGLVVLWLIMRCLLRLNYLNCDASPDDPFAPLRSGTPTPGAKP